MTLTEIVLIVGASNLPADADLTQNFSGASPLDGATPDDISFFEHPKYIHQLRATKAGLVFVPESFEETLGASLLVRVKSPSTAFDLILEKLNPPQPPEYPPGIHPATTVHASAEIDPTASVHPGAVIESGVKIGARTVIGANAFVGRNSTIGEDTLLHPQAIVHERSILGSRVAIHSGAIIGSDGYGYRFVNGRHQKIIHHGIVQLDDDVEVGACTTIDRGKYGRTWIQAGTKIDNLVQIAHNVVIGQHCLIVSQTGISGSAKLGRYVTLAGQVGVVGHIEIGDQVLVTAKSGVSKDALPGQQLMGTYGIPIKEAKELVAHYHRQPKTAAKLKALEQEVQELKTALKELLATKSTV